MIIDLILDRRDGQEYNPRQFYAEVMEYGGRDAERITRAMDADNEQATRVELCLYIIRNDYPGEICDFIRSVKWL